MESACAGCADVRGASAVPVRGCCSTRQSRPAAAAAGLVETLAGLRAGEGLPKCCWAPGGTASLIAVVGLDSCWLCGGDVAGAKQRRRWRRCARLAKGRCGC